MNEIEDFLQDNSPFLPSVDLSLLNLIVRDLFLEQGYYIGEAIAKRLLLMGTAPVLEAFTKKPDILHTLVESFREYTRGFNRPLRLLQMSYAGSAEGLGAAHMLLSSFPADEETSFILNNLDFAVEILNLDNDISSVSLVDLVVQRELQVSSNIYFQVGLEAAKRTFAAYYEIVDTLVSNLAKGDRGKPGALLQRLYEYENTVSPLPKPQSPKVQRLEKTLAQFVEYPSCGTAFITFLRHPGLILHSIGLGVRMIYNARKDPNAALRELQKASIVMPKIREAAASDWQPGEFVSRVGSDFAHIEEKISHIIAQPPYPSKDFVNEIQYIRAWSQSAQSKEGTEKILERWELLTKQPGLEQYSALWNTINMAQGELAERYAAQTADERFIRMARRAYAAPLKKSSVWKADLGTRCVCGARLGELLVKYGDILEMPVPELAHAIYDTYRDVLQGNERLYQRSPYRESREKLQDRTTLAVTRIIESCMYLSEHDDSKATNWLRTATLIAENGKSRMLRGEMALAKRLPPLEIPSTYSNDEEEYLDRLREIYAIDMVKGEYDLPSEPLSAGEISEADKLRLDLETSWTRMEEFGEAARAYVAVRRDEGIQWEEVQGLAERLGKKFAVISIYRLPDSVFLSVLRAGWEAPKAYTIPLSRQDIQEALWYCHTRLSNEWQELGELLFSPLQPLLADVEYLYFLPHGPFNRLPLHALVVDGKSVIERWAVAYAPSVSVLESALTRPKSQGDILIMAPQQNPADEWIRREGEDLAEYFQIMAVPPEVCNSDTLKLRSPSARIIHLACHGEFLQENPLDSRIFLTDKPFTARDWIGLRLQADLVTLSACETGVSKIRPGGDPEGLMRAILFAGASSLLTTLWRVESSSAYDWMLEFYRNIWDEDGLQIADKAIAFREATLALRESNPDPYIWAPFVLVGNYS